METLTLVSSQPHGGAVEECSDLQRITQLVPPTRTCALLLAITARNQIESRSPGRTENGFDRTDYAMETLGKKDVPKALIK